jgi:hypothetical protein
MTKMMYMASAALAAMAISSCNNDDLNIGRSLTSESDKLDIEATTYNVSTRTIVADSVFTLSSNCYFGRVRDPETNTDVKSEFTTQFHLLETMYISPQEKIVGRYNGMAAADSCDLILYLASPFNAKDSLQAMKMQVMELKEPIEEGRHFYSNYDPKAHGLVNDRGLSGKKMFTYANLLETDTERTSNTYQQNIRLSLNMPFTDREGVTYNNYGTYILQQYYKHPEYFANSYVFSHNVCPGIFLEITDGLGFHSRISNIGLRTHYRVQTDSAVVKAAVTLAGTQEVLQTTLVTNDAAAMKKLADERQHTYLKSPAGLFTEVTLPVDEIKRGHEADSLIAAKITFMRINNQSEDNRMFGIPLNILMVQKDSMATFFENCQSANGRTSFTASYYSTKTVSGQTVYYTNNNYTFQNISNMITELWNAKQRGLKTDPQWVEKHPDWNKVVLVPITQGAAGVEHDMSLTSTRLVGGPDNTGDPVKISVVYAKFKEE